MKNLAAGIHNVSDLLKAIDELEEELNNLPTQYPDPPRFKAVDEEEEFPD